MEIEERKTFVESIFRVLDQAGINTVDDFSSEKLANVLLILVHQKNITGDNKNKIREIFSLLVKGAK